MGSVAVRQARQATLRAQQAEQQLAAAVAERDSLARQVEELKPPEMAQAADSPSGQKSVAAMQHMHFIYSLSGSCSSAAQ